MLAAGSEITAGVSSLWVWMEPGGGRCREEARNPAAWAERLGEDSMDNQA